MTTITFLNTPSMEEITDTALGAVLDQDDRDLDDSIDALDTLQESHEHLSNVIMTAESFTNPTARELQLLCQSADLAVRPIGLSISVEGLALEADSNGFFQRVKDTLHRIWEAIKRTIAKIWLFMKQQFGKSFLQHRQLGKDIDNARIVMSQQSSMLPIDSKVRTTENLAVLATSTGDAFQLMGGYKGMADQIANFLTIRNDVVDNYSRTLTGAISMTHNALSAGQINLFDKAWLTTAEEKLNKAYAVFALPLLAGKFKSRGASTSDGNELRYDTIGGYKLVINMKPVGPASSGRQKISVDLVKETNVKFETSEIMAYSHPQIKELLDIAESLKNAIMHGTIKDRVSHIERYTESYKKFVDKCEQTIAKTDVSGVNRATLEHCQRVMNLQTQLCSDFTSWGSSIFLKMETLTMRVAIAIVRLCQLQLRNFN